ncbi:hypothetical protein OPT61_g8020 [Boeremia exigua]|uniref:Uncharacterized protein n=1 Tax=Boeremia exigua TaxID=749465 RepID=A0ACC2I0J6_9PLEO|nr:hypothetical protein OPT61_g8020 [Boeremia exigua]
MDPQREANESLYGPLSTITSIRLLHIQSIEPRANLGDDILHVTLSQVDLDDDPAFHTLSYTWGDPLDRTGRHFSSIIPDTSISCNGKEITITRNLDAALRTILSSQSVEEDGKQALWVDAICINQSNLEERSAQISIMNRIYGNALMTIGWLGSPDESSDIVTPLSKKLSALKDGAFTDIAYNVLLGELQPVLAELNRFLGRAYFTRCWVFQEVILSQQICFMCGLTKFTFEDLLYLAEAKQYLDQKLIFPAMKRIGLSFDEGLTFSIESLYRQRQAIRDGDGDKYALSFMQLLELTRQYCCSELKDKVYSVYGLLPQNTDTAMDMAPDYTKTITRVLGDAIRTCISEDRTLDTLAWVTDPTDREPYYRPSWIGELVPRGGATGDDLASILFTASATLSSRASAQMKPIEDDRVLTLIGVSCDTILEYAKPPTWDGSTLSLDSIWAQAMLLEKQEQQHTVISPSSGPLLPLTTGHKTVMCTLLSDDHPEPDPSVFQIRSRRDICYSTIQHLHKLCWFSGHDDTAGAYETVACQVLDALRKARTTEVGQSFPGMEELKLLEGFTCDCNASLLCSETVSDELATGRYFSPACPYIEEIKSEINTSPDHRWLNSDLDQQHRSSGQGTSAFSYHRYRLHRLAKTQNGYLALIPRSSEYGDAVFLLEGGRVPFIMRKDFPEPGEIDSEGRWNIIGPAYVHGAMQGEVWEKVKHRVHPVHID